MQSWVLYEILHSEVCIRDCMLFDKGIILPWKCASTNIWWKTALSKSCYALGNDRCINLNSLCVASMVALLLTASSSVKSIKYHLVSGEVLWPQ